MPNEPDWWRGWDPHHVDWGPEATVLSGKVTGRDLDAVEQDPEDGLRHICLESAKLEGLNIDLSDVSWWAAWSEVVGCHFGQRTRPVSNSQGYAGNGWLGWRPSLFRDCIFERVRFKNHARPGPPGFALAFGRFENCQFIDCRWNGHFAHHADLIDCAFVGKIDGCVWFGEGTRDEPTGAFASERIVRRNVITGNDFSLAQITDNVGWRFDFPLADQVFPDGFRPALDPPLPRDLF